MAWQSLETEAQSLIDPKEVHCSLENRMSIIVGTGNSSMYIFKATAHRRVQRFR